MTNVTYKFHRVRPKLFIRIWFIPCNQCTYLVSRLALYPNGPNRAPPDPHHLEVLSGASKMIYEPMVCLTQTEHLSCTNANTVSKHIETRFHMTHVTSEFHRVPPLLFPSLLFVRRKPCTNLASRVALSPNGPNRASTWASSPRSPIECVPKWFLCQWYVRCKPCTYLCTDTSTMSKWTKTRFHMTHVTYEFHRVSPKLFIRIWFIRWNPYTCLVSGLALSPNGLNRAPPDPRLLGVPSGASKMIYEPMLR
jgi:hypothetical protein